MKPRRRRRAKGVRVDWDFFCARSVPLSGSDQVGVHRREYVARGGHVNLSKFVPNRFMSATPRDATRYHAHTTPPPWRLPHAVVSVSLSFSLSSSPSPPPLARSRISRECRDPSKVSSPSLKLYNPHRITPRAKNPCQWSLLTDVKHSVRARN